MVSLAQRSAHRQEEEYIVTKLKSRALQRYIYKHRGEFIRSLDSVAAEAHGNGGTAEYPPVSIRDVDATAKQSVARSAGSLCSCVRA
eukprot:COSAG02_NODE_46_length_45443_cov_36.731497_24_plen_87_part_00